MYVHNLRQKLDNYYARDDGVQRLVIPKGEYRLSVVAADEAPAAMAQREWACTTRLAS